MIIKYLSFLFFSICLGLSLSSFGQLTSKETKVIAELSKNLNDDIRKDKLHGGISAAIVRKGQVIWAGAFGYSNMDKDTPADTGTIYRIASMTKTFTATLLMQLTEEGKVGLDDPADKYVPEIKSLPGYSKSRAFTLRQLASHTSGLKREPELPDASQGSPDQWEEKVLSCIPYTSFNSGPGEKFLYSNIGYALLGLALERAAGVPYIQMIQERIFTPLHMDNSFFPVPADKRDRLAEGMDNKRDGQVNTSLPLRQVEGVGYRVPNGGIWSTPRDIARFVIALEGGALLKPDGLRQMLRVPPGGRNYGLGMMIVRDQYLTLIGHDGSDPGYTSEYLIEPTSGDAIILMRNYNVGTTDLEAAAKDFLQRF